MLQDAARLFCFLPAAFSIAMFAITEDLPAPVTMVNGFTFWHLALLGVQVFLVFLSRDRGGEADLGDLM